MTKEAETVPPARPRRAQGRKRAEILDAAMDLASVEGLEGLSIGRLARRLAMSKSGVIGHFESKQDLQLETVRAAAAVFEDAVIVPGAEAPGMARLGGLLARWLDHVASGRFEGGCFFWAASAEFDGRPGPVRDAIARATAHWLELLEDEIRLAQRLGEIDAAEEPAQLAFELHAVVQEANWARQLLQRSDAFDLARRAIHTRLGQAAASSRGTGPRPGPASGGDRAS